VEDRADFFILLSLSPYADRGTRWEPTPGEGDAMKRAFVALLSPGGRLSGNEYLVLASTFHSLHAIAKQLAPVPSGDDTAWLDAFFAACGGCAARVARIALHPYACSPPALPRIQKRSVG
jgi:hypothetical protein